MERISASNFYSRSASLGPPFAEIVRRMQKKKKGRIKMETVLHCRLVGTPLVHSYPVTLANARNLAQGFAKAIDCNLFTFLLIDVQQDVEYFFHTKTTNFTY